jgi:ABC-type phosphate/phosphonate transport system substrate-binding protein
VEAPVPSPELFYGKAQYWSDLVVREDSPYHTIEQTFGRRIAFTVADSQSGCLAALKYLMTLDGPFPRFRQVIDPRITPLGAITAILQGEADIAPVDSYAFALLARYRPDLTSRLRVIARTDPTPIPAFVASPAALPPGGLGSLQAAFREAHLNPPTRTLMERLLLLRFDLPVSAAYDRLREDYEAAARFWSVHSLAAVIDPAFQSLL